VTIRTTKPTTIEVLDQASVSRIALIATIRGTIARADRLTET
jgi:hypothetical protein